MRIPRPSHATVVAYVALFAALGGSAYAVSKVGTRDLERSAVTSAKIENKTIRGTDVKNDSLGGRQIDESSLNLSKATQSEQAQGAGCTVNAGTSTFCGTTNNFDVPPHGGNVFVVAYGTYSSGPGSRAVCRIEGTGGGSQSVVLKAGATGDEFSIAAAGAFDAGVRNLSLACGGDVGATTIHDARIVALSL